MVLEDPAQMNILGAALLLALGLICIMSQNNLIKVVIGLEILAKAAVLTFVGLGGASVQGYVIIIIAIEAIVAAVALSIVVNVWRHSGSLDASDITELKG
jgi:NADH:ubiquinone oxidoreductase subunit K